MKVERDVLDAPDSRGAVQRSVLSLQVTLSLLVLVNKVDNNLSGIIDSILKIIDNQNISKLFTQAPYFVMCLEKCLEKPST